MKVTKISEDSLLDKNFQAFFFNSGVNFIGSNNELLLMKRVPQDIHKIDSSLIMFET